MKKFLKKIKNSVLFVLAWLSSLLINNLFLRLARQYAGYLRSINFKRAVKRCGKMPWIGPRSCFTRLSSVYIGDYFSSGEGLWLATYSCVANSPIIVIGNNVSLSRYCHIGAMNHIEIGDNTLIGSNVLITDHAHGESYATETPRASLPLYSRGGVIIGKNVWICDNVSILPGVKIGNNCIIAAGSVVTKSFEEDNLLIGGTPAKIIKRMEKKE